MAISCATTPRRGAYATDVPLRLTGRREVRLADGTTVTCRPVFERLASIAAEYDPTVVERITGAPADRVVAAARLLAAHRPVSHYFHNGLVQHTNATQASRAIEILYALLGDFDQPGGNVPGPSPRVDDVSGRAAPAERDGRATARARRAADRSARDAGHRHRVRPLPRDPRRRALSRPRHHLVRGQHAAGQRRLAARRPRARGARVLRPDRARAHAHEPIRRRPAPRRELDGIAGPQGRSPLPAGCDGPRPVPRGRRPAAVRTALGRRHHLRPGHAARPRRRVLGRRRRGGLSPVAQAERPEPRGTPGAPLRDIGQGRARALPEVRRP